MCADQYVENMMASEYPFLASNERDYAYQQKRLFSGIPMKL
jgi:hypothetical protein